MLSQTVQLNDNGAARVCGGNTELRFGYTKNANVYSVNFELSPEWEGLYIRVFWHVPEGDDPSSSLVIDGSVTVPPTVTAITGAGKITLEGTDGVKTITSSDITYRVSKNSGTSDDTDPEPGSSAWEQFVNEVKADADRAEASAAAAKESETNSKASETASKRSETASAASAAAAKESETNSKASETEATKQAGIALENARLASDSADAAKLSETEATKQAGIASEKANNASASAAAAKLSETEATKQAGIALQHANTSKENADSSSENARLASASADAAKLSETNSKRSETASAASEVNSKNSETASAASAAAAKLSEDAAKRSETNSKASENKSLEYLNSAKGYSDSARRYSEDAESSYQAAASESSKASTSAANALASENESASILENVKKTASDAFLELTTAKNEYLNELLDAKASHISDMETKASELTDASKKEIDSAKETALTEIDATNKKLPDVTADDAGKSLLVSEDGTGFVLGDPPVVSYTKEESDARYAPIESTIRPTVSGNPAVCEDSVAWSFQGLKVYGGIQPREGTPSPENPVPIVSAGEGGSVELDVTGAQLLPTQDVENYYVNLSGSLAGIAAGNFGKIMPAIKGVTYYIRRVSAGTRFRLATVSNVPSASAAAPTTDKTVDDDAVELSITSTINGHIVINLESAEAFNNLMVSFSKYQDYQPYRSQPLTLSTPSGLPGIPVTSGGNYTDSAGQQLLCNLIDYAAMSQDDAVRLVRLDSSLSWKDGWNKYFFIDGTFIVYSDSFNDIGSTKIKPLCSHFASLSPSILTNPDTGMQVGQGSKFNVSFRVPSTLANSLEEWKTWLDDNEVYFLFTLSEPITTPLSDEEIAAYRALTTYPGTTVVSTAEPVAGIEAKYVVDPQKYIEKYVDEKISEAVSEAVTSAIALM